MPYAGLRPPAKRYYEQVKILPHEVPGCPHFMLDQSVPSAAPQSPENWRCAARRLGMDAVQFESLPQLERELKARGICW